MMGTVSAVPVFLTFACVAGLTVALFVMARIFTPRQYVGPVQKMPYESGMDPIHDTRRRFDVRFHLIAIAFLVFDVEVLFLYPWAVAARRPGATAVSDSAVLAEQPESVATAGPKIGTEAVSAATVYDISSAVESGLASDRNIVFAGAMVFIVLLALGFIYDWRKGIFQWQ